MYLIHLPALDTVREPEVFLLLAEGADLAIAYIPFTTRCAGRDYELNSGMEFCLRRIEVAGPDASQCPRL